MICHRRQAEAKSTTAFAYCQDDETGVVYLHGQGSQFVNMDIDCDGDQSDPGDGRCGKSQDTQSTTAFQYQVQQYSGGSVSDLNANYIPYVVFGNFGSKKGYVSHHLSANILSVSRYADDCYRQISTLRAMVSSH